MNPLVLIVEDEKTIRRFIRVALDTQPYTCLEAQDGMGALAMTASHKPDVVVLDLGLPDMDGLDVIRKLREWSDVPILVVSARGHEREKVEALDAGADDYLTKPFGIAELLARIRVILRHRVPKQDEGAPAATFAIGALKIDYEKRRVTLQGEEIHLTPTEYRLLTLLASQHGKVLTHRYLVKEIWGEVTADDTQSLRVSMANLRRKIEQNPAQPKYIITEVGVGYRMVEDA
ncbi:MAG TPA: response regulator [Candidatus Limiplasma sp.]|nr:response regulator [Candidatus Limiplasma sp.]HPS81688.1 response regulator [Candidatus Limiplasma sp.]